MNFKNKMKKIKSLESAIDLIEDSDITNIRSSSLKNILDRANNNKIIVKPEIILDSLTTYDYEKLKIIQNVLNEQQELKHPEYKENLSNFISSEILKLINPEDSNNFKLLKFIHFSTKFFNENEGIMKKFEKQLIEFENSLLIHLKNMNFDNNILQKNLKISYKLDNLTNLIKNITMNDLKEEKEQLLNLSDNMELLLKQKEYQGKKVPAIISLLFFPSVSKFYEDYLFFPHSLSIDANYLTNNIYKEYTKELNPYIKEKRGLLVNSINQSEEIQNQVFEKAKHLSILNQNNFLKEKVEIIIEDVLNNKIYTLNFNNGFFINNNNFNMDFMTKKEYEIFNKNKAKENLNLFNDNKKSEEINFGF